MGKPEKRERLSVDVSPDEHRRIKAIAALKGLTIRDFVIECVRSFMRNETETADLYAMVSEPTPVLAKIWDNDKDSDYDDL